MIGYIIVGVVCLLFGGFGGYQWGAAAERKAQALLGSAQTGLANLGKKL
jgi:hypothetical protein